MESLKNFAEYLVEAKNMVSVERKSINKADIIAKTKYLGLYKEEGDGVYVFKRKADFEAFIDDLSDNIIKTI